LPSSATLDKGLLLLDHVIRDQGRTAFAELARELSIPISTAHRLLALLEERRLLVRVGKGRYRGGGVLLDLARDTDLATVLRQTSRPFLRDLAEKTGRTAHLGVLDDGMVTYLVKEQGGPAMIFTQEGIQLEAYCSAIGKVLLSNLAAMDRDIYLADGPFIALTEHTLTDPVQLRQALLDIRQQDYAIDDREVSEDLFCVAVPLRARSGRTLAAISLSCQADVCGSLTLVEVTHALRCCAEEIADRTWGN